MRMHSARYCDCPAKSRRQKRQARQAKSAGENYSDRETCGQAEVDERPPWTLHIKHSDGRSDQAQQSGEPRLRFPFHVLMFLSWSGGNTIACSSREVIDGLRRPSSNLLGAKFEAVHELVSAIMHTMLLGECLHFGVCPANPDTTGSTRQLCLDGMTQGRSVMLRRTRPLRAGGQ
jgi:hypothetical protein